MPKFHHLLPLLFAFLFSSSISDAQCNPQLAPDSSQFVTSGGPGCFLQKGNNLYLGGLSYVGKPTGGFMAVNGSGKLVNHATQAKVWGDVYCALPDGSGGWIIGGRFDKVGDITRHNIAQINAAGQLTTWNPGADSTVFAVAVNSGIVYAGGLFSTIGSVARNRIGAVSLTTGATTSWNPNANDAIYTMAISGTTLYVGGKFINIGGFTRNRIAAIDLGTAAPTSWNPNANNIVRCIALSGNKVYTGGEFTAVGSVVRNRACVIDKTTAVATAWNPNLNSIVYCIALANNVAYLGGNFTTTAGSTTRNYLAAIDTNTGAATSWNPDLSNVVYSLATDGTTVYAGGDFMNVGATTCYSFAKISAASGALTANQVVFPRSDVYTINISGSNVYIGGSLYSFGGWFVKGITVIDVAADTIVPFNINTNWTFGSIKDMKFNGNNLIVAGDFQFNIGSVNRRSLAAFDSVGNLLPWNPADGGDVRSIVLNGGYLYAGGNFTLSGHKHLAKIDLVSGAYSSWGTAYDNPVNTVAISSGRLYVGREVETSPSSGVPIMEYDATTNAYLSSISANSNVYTFYPFGSHFFTGGSFTTIGSTSYKNLVDLNPSTGALTAWSANVNGGLDVIEGNGNYLFIGGGSTFVGGFTSVGGSPHINIAAIKISSAAVLNTWTPNLYTYYDWGAAGENADVYAIKSVNSDLWISGSFNSVDGKRYNRLVRYKLNTPATVTVNITAAGGDTACVGVAKTFTAAPSGTVMSYQWKVNGVNAGTGSTYSYVPANGDVVKCIVYLDACTAIDSAVSNTRTITVRPNTSIFDSMTATDDTVCAGTSVTFTAHGISGLHYQWKKNGVITGPDDSVYTYTPLNLDSVRCIVTAPAGGCYIANPVSSPKIFMRVLPDTTPVITITGVTTMCAGTYRSFTLTSNIPGATYSWFVNDIATGATATTYTYSPLNGDMVKCVLTTPSIGCYTSPHDTSNVLTTVVTPNIVPVTTIAASENNICAGKTTNYICTTNVAGASYQWQVNETAVGSGLTAYTYAPANGDEVRCIVTKPVASCYTKVRDTSNMVIMDVIAFTTPSIIVNGPGAVPPGGGVTINAAISGAGSPYLVTWYKNGVVFNTSSTESASYAKGPEDIDTIMAKVATLAATGCYDTGTSNTIYVYAVTVHVPGMNGNTGITAYPNPFSDHIAIEGLQDGDHVALYDITGRKIYETANIGNGLLKFVVPEAAPGTYMLRISTFTGDARANIPLSKQK